MATFVFTGDDAGMGGRDMVEALRRTCRFLESRGARATWFVVPRGGGEPMRPEWREALVEARGAGHDLQLHGLTHEDCFEFGPPAWPATDISPDFAREFERRRDTLMARYTVENLRSRIAEGMEVFERDLGVHPTVFRAPCGAVSRPMFAALRDAGIHYHSCAYISGVGYDHLPHRPGVLQQKWTDAIPHRPFRYYSGVIEAPILSEYTWRGAWRRETEFVQLARQDVERVAQESPVALVLMHTHGLADNLDYAFRLLGSVMDHVEQLGGRFATLGQIAADGSLDAAATVDGPDDLAV